MGGILVNIRNRHPEQHLRDTKGVPSEEHPGKIVSYDKDKGPAAIDADRKAYLAGGDGNRKFYTRPVIDYDMALFLAPLQLAGALLGVIIQRLVPDWLYVGFAAAVLAFTSYLTYAKFFSSYRTDKERRELVRQLSMAESKFSSTIVDKETEGNIDSVKASAAEIGDEDEPAALGAIQASPKVKLTESAHSTVDCDDCDDPDELEKRRRFLQDDSRQYPKEKIAYLFLLWVGLTIMTLLQGGKGFDSIIGITCEDSAYYGLVAAQFLWTFTFAIIFGIQNVKRTQARVAVNYPFLESDVLWDAKKLQFFSFFTFAAGIVAGIIGIGGGMFLGPLMLMVGIHPSVSTATNASMILLTSSSVAVMFVISGLVPWEYAVYFFSLCLMGAYIGTTKINSYVKRTGMTSILIGILATIIALATIGCLVILVLNLDKAGWCLDGFKAFCVVKHEEDECPTRVLTTKAEETFPYVWNLESQS
jgi:uncharacterized membrane protein YfcA